MRAAFVVALSILGILGAALFGCSDSEAPPYDELSLRDALRADPRSIETVPAPMKKTLADRFERESDRASEDRAAAKVEAATSRLSAQEIVTLVDDQRSASKADAWVLSVVEVEDHAATAHPPKARSRAAGGERREDPELPPLPALEGEPAPEGTRDVEARALRGRAGATLRAMVAETGAVHVVRVSGWPVGAVVVADTLYVNATWLVSMAALEQVGSAETAPAPSVPVGVVNARPATLRGNPYATFTTLASCIHDVTARCESCRTSGACDDTATLDFPDGRSECLFLLEDRRRTEQLCLLALTSISTVAECVKADGCVPPSGASTQSSLGAAEPFLQKDACVRSLNLCLSGTNEQKDAPGNDAHLDVKVDGCSDPFKSCSSFFGGCTQACDEGKCNGKAGPSCRSCDGCSGCTRCSGCTSDSRTGDGSGYGSGGTGEDPTTGSSASSGSTGSSGTSGSGSSSGTSSGTSSSSGSTSGSSSGTSGSASSSSGGSGSSSGGSSSGGSSSGCGKSSSSSSGGGSSSGGCNSCKGCSSGSGGGSGCKCEETPVAPREDEEEPFGPGSHLAWLAAPLVFLGKRARRVGKLEREEDDSEGEVTR